MIAWAPPNSSGADVEYLTHIRPVGDAPDFRQHHFVHRNHLRVDRLRNVPEGSYVVEVWAARVHRDGNLTTTLAESVKVIRNVTVTEDAAITLTSLAVSDLLFDDLNNRHYLTLSFTANKCVFLDVTGATTLRSPDFHGENCFSEVHTELDPVEPGTHTITVTATDRDGASIAETTSFVIGGPRQPCRLAKPPPDPWRVKVGVESVLELKLTGDCGEVIWRYDDWSHAGFAFDDGVLTANVTGQPRGEQIHLGVAPALSESFGFDVSIVVYTDDKPDVVPCTMDVDKSLMQNGRITLRVPSGGTVTTKIGATGDCDPYRWEQSPASIPGVTFANGVLTISGEGPPRTEEFSISLLPEHGTSWGQFVVVEVTG